MKNAPNLNFFYRTWACLFVTLLLFALGFSAHAEAYIARSSSGRITTYGVARSQPTSSVGQTPSQPAPAPVQPAPPETPAPPPPAPEKPVAPPAPAPTQPVYRSSSGTAYGISYSSGYQTPNSSISQPAPSQPSQPAPPPPAPEPTPPPPGSGTVTLNAQEQLLLNLVNNERARRGLAPLHVDSRLTQLARLKSQDMIDNSYFAHESPVYGRSGDMLRSAGVSFRLAAENIGVGGNVNSIFSAFMHSSPHRNKIVDSRYTLTGIGIIHQPGRGYLVTQLFVQP